MRAREPPLPGRITGGPIPGPVRNPATVDILDGLLGRERSALATYALVVRALAEEHLQDLEDNRGSHARRVALLVGRILDLGGVPVTAGPPWRACVRALRSAAAMTGPAVVLRALAAGEYGDLGAYIRMHATIDPVSTVLLRDVLLPEQVRSHARVAHIAGGPPG